MKSLALVALLLAGCPKGSDNKKTIEPVPGSGGAVADGGGRVLLPGDAAGSAAAVALAPAHPLPEVPLGLPPLPPAAAAVTPEALALGELAFWEPRLAADAHTACATCHDPARGYAGVIDHKPVAPLANAAWRAPDLAARLPAHAQLVLGNDLATAAARLGEVPLYAAHLARIGGAPGDALGRALAAYALTRYDGDSPWDRMERVASGAGAANPVVAGYKLFGGKAQCAVCHTPPLYTDLRAHAGVITPSLRGVEHRPAYFHDASATALDQALAAHPTAEARPVVLSAAERTSLVAFLRALSATAAPPAKPVLP